MKTTKEIPLKKETLIHLILIHNRIKEAVSEVLKPFDISIQQYNVLRILRGQNKKPANLSTINERMVSKMSNTTRLVDKLISKGLVDRSVCPTNRRKVEILITNDGLDALAKMDEAVDGAEDFLTGDFNDNELKTLNALLNKFK
nr:MarR family transcriptional regulator [Leptobacterium flavescens]